MDGPRKRQSYTREDETNMWMFLYRELKKANPAASEPRGLRIWEEYIRECHVNRTVDSLNTRFRRHMIDNLHKAALNCHVMMFLYRRLQLEMTSDVRRALELKFSVDIKLYQNRHVQSFTKVARLPRHEEEETDEGHPAENTASSNVRAQDEPIISSQEGSLTPPTKRLNSSLNFTQQVEDVVVNSRYEVRYKRRPDEIHDDDFDSPEEGSSPTQSPSACIAGPSRVLGRVSSQPQISESPDVVQDSTAKETASKASQDQFSPLEEQVLCSSEHVRMTAAKETISNANRAAVASTSPTDGQHSTPQLDPIFVSESSDTCESAYQRLYCAIVSPSDQPPNNPDTDAELRKITEEWQNRIESMLEKSEISSGAAEKYLYSALKAQKDLLGRDQNNYAKSLCALEKHMEKRLQTLRQSCKPAELPPISQIVSPPIHTLPMNLTLTDKTKIPHEVRKEKVQELFSSLNSHEHFLTIKEIINPIIKLEGHAAEMSEQEYENYMLRIKDAVKERIRQINRTRSK